jgi:uroporphyrinogen-III decarboxylase
MSHMNGWMFESEIENVAMSLEFLWRSGSRILRRTYHTPLGSVYEDLIEEPGYRSLTTKKFLISDIPDYEVVRFIVQNTRFRPMCDEFLEARENLGSDGVQLAVADRSPYQKMLIELCGPVRLSFDLFDHPDVVDDLLCALEKKQDEAYQIIADSPAEIVWIVDNVTSDLTEPRAFQKYGVPFYNKQARLLHARNKILAVHLDGKLRAIKDLIAETDIDVVESFSLPEVGGDLTMEEADAAWPDKAIIANIPASLSEWAELEIREYLEGLLRRIPGRRNFMLEFSENIPRQYLSRTLSIVSEVMQNQ